MTRINLVDPKLLVRQHLIAEYRELPRIYALVRDRIAAGETHAKAVTLSPAAYTLGTGHCRFFYTRLEWLTVRYMALIEEMRARGFKPSFDAPPTWALDIPRDWWGCWQPTQGCIRINIDRINERLRGMGLHCDQLTYEGL